MATPLASLKVEAVGDWEPCAELFYSMEHIYDMDWVDIELEHKKVCAGTFAGPLATVRDESALVVLRPGASTQPVMRLFSPAGRETGNFLWDKGPVAGWGWTAQQELLLVTKDGQVLFYSVHGRKLPKDLLLGPEVQAAGVTQALVGPDQVVVLTGGQNRQLVAVVGLAGRRPVKLASLPAYAWQEADGAGGPVPMVLLQPHQTQSRGLEVIVALGETLWVVDDTSVTDTPLSPGCLGVTHMALSPDGAFVAVACLDGKVRVLSSDMSKVLSELTTANTDPPLEVTWCGGDAVVLRWPDLLLLAGPYGEHLTWPLEGPVVLVPEVDGLRLITATTHKLLRRVADCLVAAFKPGSVAPPARLLDARELFDQGSARADRLLRDIGPDLGAAVEACIAAAGCELSVLRQRALLRAAVLGRAFCKTDFPQLLLVNTCRQLRVLNALRDPSVGLPLTLAQLQELTAPQLVSRLVGWHYHMLAYQVAQVLGVGQDQVLLHWACAKVTASSNTPDDQLKEAVSSKLSKATRPRFAAVAAHAQSIGRRSLAIALLEEESSPGQQVPLLISLATSSQTPGQPVGQTGGEEEADTLAKALRRAVESGDPDLVYLALFAAYKARPLPRFWELLQACPPAKRLWIKYTRAKDPELLDTVFISHSLLTESADLELHMALQKLSSSSSSSSGGGGGGSSSAGAGYRRPDEATVMAAAGSIGEAAKKFDRSREAPFQAKAANELSALLKEQVKLESETGQSLFLGLSLSQTLATLLRLGHSQRAENLRNKFSMPEQHWYWLKLQTLAAAHDWEGLEAFAAKRKTSPIGWEPFLEVARKHGAPRDYLVGFVSRLPDTAHKAEEYAALGYQREAAEVAAKLRDGDLFGRIQAAVSANSPAGLAIAQLKDRFQSSFR